MMPWRKESQSITLVLNGRSCRIQHGSSLLAAFREHGFFVPTLCHLSGLGDCGVCRLCLVWVKGETAPVSACTRLVEPGMDVRSEGRDLRDLQAGVMELLLSEHGNCGNKDCEIEQTAELLGLQTAIESRLSTTPSRTRKTLAPLLSYDAAPCVSCLRCVRACERSLLEPRSRVKGVEMQNDGRSRSLCVQCGDCARACPSGALQIQSLKENMFWPLLQSLLLLIGLSLVTALFCWPEIGLFLLWDVLIPVAPALFLIAPGLWRNICPLGTISLLPARLGISTQRHLRPGMQHAFFLIAWIALYAIVPLRKVVFDHSGAASAWLLISAGLFVIGSGLVFSWKSAWCSGLCPVLPVEALYGGYPIFSVRNAQCTSCNACVSPCRDADQRSGLPSYGGGSPRAMRIALQLGYSFPGFVLGWFLLGDDPVEISTAYAMPLGLAACASAVFFCAEYCLTRLNKGTILRVCGLLALGCYYWFKLPAMLGFAEAWVLRLGLVIVLGYVFWSNYRAGERRKAWASKPR